jgi:hypothetical protein
VSEPDAPTSPKNIARLEAAQKAMDVLALADEIRKRERRLHPAVIDVITEWFESEPRIGANLKPGATLEEVLEYVRRLHFGIADLDGEGKPTAEAHVTKSTMLEQYARLPCGQQIVVLVLFLLVLLSFDLPDAVKNQLWGLITELGAAIWIIQRITKR